MKPFSRQANSETAQETLSIIEKGEYEVEGKKFNLKRLFENNKKMAKVWVEEEIFSIQEDKSQSKELSKITVTNRDIVETMQLTHIMYPTEKIGVLNFASARNPGGGFKNGSMSQEESIAYVSDLYNVLKDCSEFYKYKKHFADGLYSHRMITSPITVFRDYKHELIEPYQVFLISAAAVNATDIKNKKITALYNSIDRVMEERIENIIKLAKNQQVEVLILGAFGCGVFGNNPYVVKSAFKKVLSKSEYKNAFKEVIFSIYDKKDKKNLSIFKDLSR